jgi:hypothetical protein
MSVSKIKKKKKNPSLQAQMLAELEILNVNISDLKSRVGKSNDILALMLEAQKFVMFQSGNLYSKQYLQEFEGKMKHLSPLSDWQFYKESDGKKK